MFFSHFLFFAFATPFILTITKLWARESISTSAHGEKTENYMNSLKGSFGRLAQKNSKKKKKIPGNCKNPVRTYV